MKRKDEKKSVVLHYNDRGYDCKVEVIFYKRGAVALTDYTFGGDSFIYLYPKQAKELRNLLKVTE